MLKKQCRDTGQDAADQKLDAGHFYSINERRKMINNQNMTGKKNCTDDQKKFTFADCKPLSRRQTQEIKSAQRKQDCNPDKGTAFLFQENTDDRNNDDVACSNKTGFSNCCVFNTKLLKITCKTEHDTTADASDKQRFASGCGRFPLFFCFGMCFVKYFNDREQGQCTDKISHGIKCKSANVVHADTLGDKGDTPYGSGQKKQKRISDRD